MLLSVQNMGWDKMRKGDTKKKLGAQKCPQPSPTLLWQKGQMRSLSNLQSIAKITLN